MMNKYLRLFLLLITVKINIDANTYQIKDWQPFEIVKPAPIIPLLQPLKKNWWIP